VEWWCAESGLGQEEALSIIKLVDANGENSAMAGEFCIPLCLICVGFCSNNEGCKDTAICSKSMTDSCFSVWTSSAFNGKERRLCTFLDSSDELE
jgi:hypothetical protein